MRDAIFRHYATRVVRRYRNEYGTETVIYRDWIYVVARDAVLALALLALLLLGFAFTRG